jgi:hypothetical protein
MRDRLLRFYRQARRGAPVIVVSGLPRSGTSMMMRMLEAGGAPLWTDDVRAADESNPRGYYELERVKELGKSDTSWMVEARGKAVKIVSPLLVHLPDACNYRVVFMLRDLREIVASQNRMLDDRGEPHGALSDEALVQAYETHLWQVRQLFRRRACFEVIDVHYVDVLNSAASQAARVEAFLRLGLDVGRMPGVVEEGLYRNRRG